MPRKTRRKTKPRSPEQEALYLTALLDSPRNSAKLDWITQSIPRPADRIPALAEMAIEQGHFTHYALG